MDAGLAGPAYPNGIFATTHFVAAPRSTIEQAKAETNRRDDEDTRG
jgi:hypothetical protein